MASNRPSRFRNAVVKKPVGKEFKSRPRAIQIRQEIKEAFVRPDGIDFIHENNAWLVVFGVAEHLPDDSS